MAENNTVKEEAALADVTNNQLKRTQSGDGDDESDVMSAVKKRRYELEAAELATTLFAAPVIWASDAGADGKALFVDDAQCIVGTRAGKVLVFNHTGQLMKQWKLHSQVGAIFQDGEHLYVWCHAKHAMEVCKGTLYEICGDDVIHQFDLVDFGEVVDRACMYGGCLVLGDSRGSVAALSVEGDFLWQTTENKTNRPALLQVDQSGVYASVNNSVRKYDLRSGDLLWEFTASSGRNTIQCGVLHECQVYVEVGGEVIQVDGVTGSLVRRFTSRRQRACGVVVGGGLLATGACPTHIFDLRDGRELYKMNFSGRLDDAVSVIHASSKKMFVFWDHLYCIDLSDWSVKRALNGTTRPYLVNRAYGDVTEVVIGSPPPLVAPCRNDVILECDDVDGVIMVRAVGDEYEAGKFVAVPLAWREIGRRFAVDGLEDCPLANCYRLKGQIRMIPSEPKPSPAETQTSKDARDSKPTTPAKSPSSSPLKITLTSSITPTTLYPQSPQKVSPNVSLVNGGTTSSPSKHVSSITIPVNQNESPAPSSDRKKRRRTGNFLSLLSVDLTSPTDNK